MQPSSTLLEFIGNSSIFGNEIRTSLTANTVNPTLHKVPYVVKPMLLFTVSNKWQDETSSAQAQRKGKAE